MDIVLALRQQIEDLCCDISKLNDKVVIEALWLNSGMLAATASFLNVSYRSLRAYVENDRNLVKLVDEITSVKSDLLTEVLENKAFREAMSGDNQLLWKLLNVYSNGKFGTKTTKSSEMPDKITNMIAMFREIKEDDRVELCASTD